MKKSESAINKVLDLVAGAMVWKSPTITITRTTTGRWIVEAAAPEENPAETR